MSILRSARAVLLAFVAIGCAASAHAEFCRCDATSFTWQGCDAASCDAAGWTNCTPSADDRFTIGASCAVEVGAGADVLLEHFAAERVRVEAGGELVVRGPVEWRVGPGGFEGLAGSRVELAGCFRGFGTGAADCTPSLETQNLFTIGDVKPCLDSDCSDGDAALVRIEWPAPAYPTVATLLSRIDAQRDALCFWQASEAGYVGADAGYCYAITAVGNVPSAPHLDFDVRQVWRSQSDQAGYPLARREVQEGTLQGAHPIGAREIRLNETDVVVGRIDQMGRWVRCAGQQRAYLIASVRDDAGGDVLVLADDRGLASSFADGERCHVDWGWGVGDVAFVMAPVHVTSTTNADNQVHMRLEGAASLSAVVLDGLGGSSSNGRGSLQIVGGPLEQLEHVWITDPLVNNREALYLDELPCGSSAYHVTISGGPSDPAFDRNYGIAWFGGATCGYTLTHFYPRHRADDNFVLESLGLDPIAALTIRYMHAGPSSFPGDSGQMLDLGVANPTVLDAADLLCTACTSQDGVGPLIVPAQGGGTLARTLWVGPLNGGAISNAPGAGIGDPRFVDFGVVGSAVDASNLSGYGPIVGLDAERFYVRDFHDPRSTSSQLCIEGVADTERLRGGVFLRTDTGSQPCELSAAAELTDVYFVDAARTGSNTPLVRVLGTATNVTLRRLTMAFTAPPVGLSRGIAVTAGGHAVFDGPLLTGFRGAGVLSAMSFASPAEAAAADWGAPTCFYDNDVDDSNANLAAYGTPPIRGVDPEFVNPATGRFDLAPASPLRPAGCGAGEAGVRDTNWAHRKAKLRPIYMGARASSACGLGVELMAPIVLLILRISRRSGAA